MTAVFSESRGRLLPRAHSLWKTFDIQHQAGLIGLGIGDACQRLFEPQDEERHRVYAERNGRITFLHLEVSGTGYACAFRHHCDRERALAARDSDVSPELLEGAQEARGEDVADV